MAVTPRISTKQSGGTGGINARITLYTPGITKDLRDQLRKQVLNAARFLADDIKSSLSASSSSPGGPPAMITGNLIDSISVTRPIGTKLVAEVVQDFAEAPYGPWLEFGAPNRSSSPLPAYPFMVPAVARCQNDVKDIVSNVRPRSIKTNPVVIESRS